MPYGINLHKLTVDELCQLKAEIDNYVSKWFGFSSAHRESRTPNWIKQAKWRLDGQTEPCCECGDDYPKADLHFDGEIYCPKCRATTDNSPKK